MRVHVIQDDITTLAMDAIVNAATTSLLGGGGVDGAIHLAAGPDLVQECRMLQGCRPGEAKITNAYRLPARHIIHTVGPVWQGGARGEADTLASCYRRSLEVASAHGLKTIAFPSISTGKFRYPVDLAAEVAVKTVLAFQNGPAALEEVVFCCFSSTDLAVYQSALAKGAA